jgi:Fe2+ or Zn2+ uptake regulation protein
MELGMGRKSKQKEAILKVVKSTDTHPTADWVYGQVRHAIPNISLGTVYRNLKLLTRDGEILGLGGGNTVGRFDGNIRDHYHFRCERCNRVLDLDEPVDKTMNERLAQRLGVTVNRHSLEFYGLCQDCQSGITNDKAE